MRVIGPNWPSTHLLQEALSNLEGNPLRWGVDAISGLEQLTRLSNAGVPCPIFTTSKLQVREWIREGKEVWGRSTFHTQGTDIIGKGHRKFWERDFWVLKIPSIVAEYRQHIWDGKGIRRGKKLQVEEPSRKLEVRSRKNGWHIDYGPFPSPPTLREIGKKAVQVVGYKGGAVDVVEDREGKLWVLEVNSAPSLKDENTLKAYVDAIKGGIGR